MMKYRFLFVVLLSLMANCLQAKEVVMADGRITMQMPEGMVEEGSRSYLYVGSCKDYSVGVAILNQRTFDRSDAFDRVDTLLYGLRGFERVDWEREWIWQLNRDYEMHFYEAKGTDVKHVTYTWTDRSRCYCMVFSYMDDKQLETFDGIIDSIKMSDEKGIGEFFLIWKYSGGMLLLFFIVFAFCGAIMHEPDAAFSDVLFGAGIVATIAGLVFLPLMWGWWVGWLLFTGCVFLLSIFTVWFGVYLTLDVD